MANYIKSTDFAAKDLLPKGDPSKKIVGAEIDKEFSNIAESIQTKLDRVPVTTGGNFPVITSSGQLEDSGNNINSLIKALLPTGVVLPYSSSVIVPDGFLLCEGQAVSRQTYSDLFLLLGTTYGSGNGTTTFNLPDLRERIIMGSSGKDVPIGSKGGSKEVVLNREQIPSHEHHMFANQDISGLFTPPPPVDANSYVARSALWYIPAGESAVVSNQVYSLVGTTTVPSVGRTGTNRTGNPNPINVVQPYLVLNYIIKT